MSMTELSSFLPSEIMWSTKISEKCWNCIGSERTILVSWTAFHCLWVVEVATMTLATKLLDLRKQKWTWTSSKAIASLVHRRDRLHHRLPYTCPYSLHPLPHAPWLVRVTRVLGPPPVLIAEPSPEMILLVLTRLNIKTPITTLQGRVLTHLGDSSTSPLRTIYQNGQ